MYLKNAGAITYNVRNKAMANTERNRRISGEAEKWKALALQPVGKVMKIQKRQFIGDHPITRAIIKREFYKNAEDLKQIILNMIQK